MSDQMQRLTAALAGRYAIEREIGVGGMATVYLAEDLRHGRKVALKVLRPDLAATLGPDRFLREIAIAANLQHPHILPVYDSGNADGMLYYIMPFVEGQSLRERLTRERELPVSESVRILRDVADAMAAAHSQGVVHRDIKPENVMLSGRHALVADFGVAKAVSEATGREALTTVGVAVGTPAYMPPEQASADPHVDHRADIYAFGVMAYEMMTGQPPFTAVAPQEVMAAHLTEAPVAVTQRRATIPPPLAQLIMRCLEKKAADRPQRADELLPVLEALATPSGGITPTDTHAVPAVTRARRRWGAVALVGAAVVIVALGVSLALRGAAAPRPDPTVVVVRPFENRTGDTAYGALGQNVAERVTRGLSDIGTVELVGAGGAASSAGAGTVIAGSLYHRGDSLEVTATIAESPSQLVLRTVGPLRAPAAGPEPAIAELVQRLMGGVAMMFDQTYGNQGMVSGQPPTYDAYREYRTGEEHFYAFRWDSAVAHFQAAIRVDSTFMFSRVRIANAYSNATEYVRADSALGTIEVRRSRLTPFEEAYAAYLRAGLQGDNAAAYLAAQRMGRAAPRSDFAAYYYAIGARFTGRWQQLLDILGPLDPDGPMLRGRLYYHEYVTLAWHMLGDHGRELQAAERGLRQYPDRLMIRRTELRALAALGRLDDVRARLADVWTIRVEDFAPADAVLNTAQELRAHGYPEASGEVLESLLDRLGTRPASESRGPKDRWVRAQALMLLGRLDEARWIADSLRAEHPASTEYLGARGVIAALRGDRAAAGRIADSLAALTGPYRFGVPTAWRAGIAAILGDRPGAVQLLSEAMTQGYTDVLLDDASLLFESLRDDPRFQQLRRPRP